MFITVDLMITWIRLENIFHIGEILEEYLLSIRSREFSLSLGGDEVL